MTRNIYKFLHGNRSEKGNHTWRLNKWYKTNRKLRLCGWGFHGSEYIQDAMYWVHGDTLAVMEVRGKHLEDGDKECWSEARIIKRYKWGKKHSLKMAIFSAESVLDKFEREYPDDKRVQNAIESAKVVLGHDTCVNRAAAAAAAGVARDAARVAAGVAARAAAWVAAGVARDAGGAAAAARAAAAAAAGAAGAAGDAAWAARDAAWAAMKKKIHDYIINEILQVKI